MVETWQSEKEFHYLTAWGGGTRHGRRIGHVWQSRTVLLTIVHTPGSQNRGLGFRPGHGLTRPPYFPGGLELAEAPSRLWV